MSVDSRIVTMKFDNREFERNASTTLGTLAKIKESMNFGTLGSTSMKAISSIGSALSKLGLKTPFAPLIKATTTGLTGVGTVLDKLGLKNPFSTGIQSASELQRAAQAAGGPAGMGVLEGGVTAVSSKFIALSTIAITALSNITNRAISSGTAFLKSFSTQPILDGLHEYETNLKAIQTVQANTDRPLPEINSALEQLNAYSDQTIYNFGEMAKNVGTFTAAGVDLETSVSAIKGIANMAALSGSNSQQAATAMYQLSQALASGKVGLMDWNSVVNAGMGGKKLQNALAQTAIAMGEIDEAQVKGTKSGEQLTISSKSFRESIMAQPGQESWLTSDILKNALATLDGRFSDAALSQEELANGTLRYKTAAERAIAIDKARAEMAKKGVVYTDEQFEALKKLSTQAFESATKVKTLGQVFEIAKETIGSGWSASFKSIFGDLDQAKSLFTGMSEGLGEILKNSARTRNEMLADWNEMGGRTDVIHGLKNAWQAVLGILGPIKRGFRDIFPATETKNLLDMSEQFKAFMKTLIPGKSTMADIRDIAGGLFAILSIGKTILGGVVTLFKTLFEVVGGGNGDFLDFAAGIGNMIKEFDTFLKESGLVTAFFESIGNVLSVPLILLKGVGTLIGSLFNGFDESAAGKIGDAVDGVGNRLSGLEIVGDKIMNFFRGLGGTFEGLGTMIGNALMGIGDVIAGAFTPETFGTTLDAINTGLLAGIVLLIKNFFSKGVNVDVGGGFFASIKETLGAATGALENMQASLKADILMKIALSIGVLAGSLLVLSMIDPAALRKALAAMTGGFAILIGAMVVLMKVMGPTSIVRMYVITAAMTKMSASILLMSIALKVLSGIKFGDMLRGLVGLGLMMLILSKSMVPLAAGSKGMMGASASLILVAIAINMLAVALKIFATMSWAEMIKGLAGLTGTLVALAIGLKLMPPMQASALGLVALGLAMNMLAVALKIFATMSWQEMAKGLLMLAGSLGIIAIAMNAMPKSMLIQAAALVVVAGAMTVLAGALRILGGMSWKSMAKGLIMLGGSLAIIAIGLNAMGLNGLLGAAALVAVAAAMTLMLPVLVAFGAMDWMTILKSLTMLAAVFVILGVAGYALAPVSPVIVALGAALLLLGAGLALAGAGALMAATAFGIVVAAGAAGAQVMAQFLTTIINAIPPAMAAFGKGVVQFAVAIGEGAPKIAAAFGKILTNMINTVIQNTPKLARMFLVMLNAAIRVVVTAIPKIVDAGLRLIIGFLEAISRHLPRIIDLAADIIVKFIQGIARNLPDIIQAGVDLILALIRGIAKAIRENDTELGEAGADLGLALIEGIANGISGAAGKIKDAAMQAAEDAMNAVKDFFGINSPSKRMYDEVGVQIPAGMAGGIRHAAPLVSGEMKTLGQTAMGQLSETMRAIDEGFAMSSDLNPTITPVLDLAKLTQDANKMSEILATSPIMPTTSYEAASAISMETSADQGSSGGDDESSGGGDTYNTYEQHLHSPKALDQITIYRSSKSLFALKKGEL